MARPVSRRPGPDPGPRDVNEERELRAKLRADPDHAETRARLAAYFEGRGRTDEAAREHFRIAAAARARGDEAALAAAIAEVLRLDPSHAVLFTDSPPRRRRKAGDEAAHIVVAHEEDEVRTTLVRVLESWGHKVSGAATATELAALAAPPDLLIVGPRLPDLSGFELAHAVRESRPRLAVIMLTAGFRPESALLRGEAPEGVVDEYLERPFTPTALEEKVNACLWRAAHAASVPAFPPALLEPARTEAPAQAETPAMPAPAVTAASSWAEAEAPPPPLSVPARGGSPATVAAMVVVLGLALMSGADLALRLAMAPPAPPPETRLLAATPTPPPPDPVTLWRKLSRTQANDAVSVQATILTPELASARAYHAALKTGAEESAAWVAAQAALAPYDFDHYVYLALGFQDLTGLGLATDPIYAGLRLGAPGAVAVGAQFPAPVFAPRLVRESGDGVERIRLLSFQAAFARDALRDARIAILEVAEPAPALSLSLPLVALSLGEGAPR